MDDFSGCSHGKGEFTSRISGCAELRLGQGRRLEKIGKGLETKHSLAFTPPIHAVSRKQSDVYFTG